MLIKVSVRYLASFAIVVGRREETLLVPDETTVKELLTKLVERHGPSLGEEIFDSKAEEIRPHVLVLVNGRSVYQLAEKLNTKILYGDSVILTLPMSGG
jgi:MoaD family protein